MAHSTPSLAAVPCPGGGASGPHALPRAADGFAEGLRGDRLASSGIQYRAIRGNTNGAIRGNTGQSNTGQGALTVAARGFEYMRASSPG
jgi:hypothetical protein